MVDGDSCRAFINGKLSESPPADQGVPGDGKVHTGRNGKLCCIDKSGKTYPVRPDGVRDIVYSTRPLGIDPQVWARMTHGARWTLIREACKATSEFPNVDGESDDIPKHVEASTPVARDREAVVMVRG